MESLSYFLGWNVRAGLPFPGIPPNDHGSIHSETEAAKKWRIQTFFAAGPMAPNIAQAVALAGVLGIVSQVWLRVI